ncbi:MAG: Gfo/Idh/MocA family oxidoreductase [Ruminococcaceae bacterium]|nr:Gfo/Idh/MocA family oxidoreductase [Oscillospiraceae bacterium]
MSLTPLRIAVIGVGNIGSAHAKTLYTNSVEGAVLSAVCDTDPKKRLIAQEEYKGVRAFASTEELFKARVCDAVIVSVPHPSHAEVCLQALSADLHVLVEKPVDITVTKAIQLNKAFKASGKVFGIMFNQRTTPIFQRARELVRGRELGEVKRSVWIITNWYRDQAYYDSGDWRASWQGEGGGVLMNQAPHNLDLWQWILGMPKTVSASCEYGKYHNIEVEDDCTINATWENGAKGVFITSTGEYPGTNRLEISLTKGKMVLESSTLKLWKYSNDEREFCFDPSKKPSKEEVEYSETVFEPHRGGHRLIVQNFTDAILKGAELLSPGYDGINQISLTNAAYLSQWLDKPVTLPFDNELYDKLLEERIKNSVTSKKEGEFSPQSTYKDRWQVNW